MDLPLRRAALAAAVLALLGGCPRTPQAGGPAPTPVDPVQLQVDGLRAEAKALLTEQAQLYWRNWALGEDVDLAATYEGHGALFSQDSIALVERARTEAKEAVRREALAHFRDYLVGEHVAMKTAPLAEQIASVEASATVNVHGAEIAYRDLGRILAREPDPALRRAMSDAALPVLARLEPLLMEKARQTTQVAGELGHRDYLTISEALRGVDLEALGGLAEQVLERTDGLYQSALERVAQRELGQSVERLGRADVPRLFRVASVDAAFPAEDMLPRLEATLTGLGLGLDAGGRITLDAEPRPRKNPRAVCFPVDVPVDIRLSIKPVGGPADYQALFHEMGHAQHFAHVETPVFEFQQLGSNAVSEAYAFLFEGLLGNREWLATHAGLTGEALDRFLEHQSLQRLYLIRRYAAKILFELAWRRGAEGDPETLYGDLLSRAYGFPLDENDRKRWLTDLDDFFYSADYLRAWLLEAQLEASLQKRHGPRWWADPAAGRFLRELWTEGSRFGPEDLAKRLGARLSPEALLERLGARLGTPAA